VSASETTSGMSDSNAMQAKPYYQDSDVEIYHGNYEELLPVVAVGQLLATDPPYAITSNKWDTPIDLAKFWGIAWSVCCGPVVMTASQPFTAIAVASQIDAFKHEWIWQKNRGSNFANTVREPFKEHESVLVFAKAKWTYNPIRQPRNGTGASRAKYNVAFRSKSQNYRNFDDRETNAITDDRLPSSVQQFNTETGLHPTQKPTGLFEYLISTYTNAGDRVIDPFAGSGTTAVAARAIGRKATLIEREERYCEIAANRLSQGVLF
jgi:hypothetical protein